MSRQDTIWLDGSQVSALPLPDRGLDFGDGLFETMLVHRGQPLFEEYHLERLCRGLQALAIPDCLQNARAELRVATETVARNWEWAVIRISVLRGVGPRGYTPLLNAKPRILIRITQLDSDHAMMPSPAKLGVAEIFLSNQPFLAGIKHSNRLEQVIAATEAQSKGVDECILLDDLGQVVSVIAGNIFLMCKGELCTPILDRCGVEGTRRRLIMEIWAPSIGLNVRETRMTLSDLESADEVFYSNSLHTVRPIARLNLRTWEDHSVCASLFQQYLKVVS
ncbi:MAG: aminodeoxychorismate lyase [Halioglobus sp.]